MSKQQKVLTSIRISHDTYTKLHFLKHPFETHDEALNRVLGDHRVCVTKIKMLEELVIKNGTENRV